MGYKYGRRVLECQMMIDDFNAAFRREIDRPDGDLNLFHATLLMATDEYPDLDVRHYLTQLDVWAGVVRARVASHADVAARLRHLNQFLFQELGFSGNSQDFYDPRNSYMNEVLERRRGIPITLSVIYMELGRRLALDLAGVSFPGHFLVKLAYGGGEVVIDPYHRGISLSAADLSQRLKNVFGMDVDSPARFLEAASNKHILLRILHNLRGIYQHQDKAEKALIVINRLLLIDPDSTPEYRERGLLFNRLECYHAALKDLQHYLRARPEADDASAIRELILRLQGTHSRLN